MTHTKVVVCLDTRQIYSQAFPKTKNTWTEYGLNALNMFFSPLFLISVMAPKRCFVWTHTHTLHQHTAPSSSLLTLHHHANPACFTRQETEKLIVIPQGSADLSQICLRSAPHFTSFPTCFGFQGSKKISHLRHRLQMREISGQSPVPEESLTQGAREFRREC